MKIIEADLPYDGSDQTDAFQAAIDEAQTDKAQLHLGDGIIGLKRQTVVDALRGPPIRIVGAGAGNMRVALNVIGAIHPPACTMLKWIGAAAGEAETPMLAFKRCIGIGHGLEGVRLNCNARAAHGLEIDGCAGGNYRNIAVDWLANGVASSYGIKIWTSTYGVTCSMNVFERLTVIANNSQETTNRGRCLWLHGTVKDVANPVLGGNDACHNHFSDTTLFAAGSRHSLELGFCDNNTFINTWANNTGTGYGVFANHQNGQSNGAPVHNLFVYLTTPSWFSSLNAHNPNWTGNTVLGWDSQHNSKATVRSGYLHRLRDIGTAIEKITT